MARKNPAPAGAKAMPSKGGKMPPKKKAAPPANTKKSKGSATGGY